MIDPIGNHVWFPSYSDTLISLKEWLEHEINILESFLTDFLFQNEGKLQQERDELRKMITDLENELLGARQDSEEKALELEQLHADCMLLEDQLVLKEEASREPAYSNGSDGALNEEIENLQAKLAAQEHMYQSETVELRDELEELREAMIRTHEENIEHRVRLAEKDQIIQFVMFSPVPPLDITEGASGC
eukprot:sb/3471110/